MSWTKEIQNWITWLVSPVNGTPLASSRMSPGWSMPVHHADWLGNNRLIRISPGNAAFVSMPPDTDNPSPRGPFGTWTAKQQSENKSIFEIRNEQKWRRHTIFRFGVNSETIHTIDCMQQSHAVSKGQSIFRFIFMKRFLISDSVAAGKGKWMRAREWLLESNIYYSFIRCACAALIHVLRPDGCIKTVQWPMACIQILWIIIIFRSDIRRCYRLPSVRPSDLLSPQNTETFYGLQYVWNGSKRVHASISTRINMIFIRRSSCKSRFTAEQSKHYTQTKR